MRPYPTISIFFTFVEPLRKGRLGVVGLWLTMWHSLRKIEKAKKLAGQTKGVLTGNVKAWMMMTSLYDVMASHVKHNLGDKSS